MKLQQYVDKGGKIFPDLLKGEKLNIQKNQFSDTLKSDSTFKELEIRKISVNEYSIRLNGEKGVACIERKVCSLSWMESHNKWKELKLYKADNVISAVYLDDQKGELKFKYNPTL